MLTLFNRMPEAVEDMLLVVGRLLLSGIFIHEGIDLAFHLAGAIAAMGKLGVPWPMVLATITLQLCAGLAIALGWQTRPAALGLGLFCVATATLFHANVGRHDELLQFEKDLAIAGGMSVLFVRGSGRFALEHLQIVRSFAGRVPERGVVPR